MFDGLNKQFAHELEVVNEQHPYEPLQYLRPTLRLTFEEGIKMLQDAGIEGVDPLGDLSTEVERQLGKLVKEKYKTDFYILHRYPLAARPFYTMPASDDGRYTNSFDVFIRGEEIISGAFSFVFFVYFCVFLAACLRSQSVWCRLIKWFSVLSCFVRFRRGAANPRPGAADAARDRVRDRGRHDPGARERRVCASIVACT